MMLSQGGAVRYPLRYVLDTMRRCAFTSLPRAQDTGGENPYICPKDVSKLLIVGDSAVRLLITLGARSAW
jgi:hypothetical protein